MKKTYFTPGPSQLYPSVKKHIRTGLQADIASISHRSATFHAIVKQTYDDLRSLLTIPEDYHIFFLASATEAMERIIENCVDETSFHFVNGAFSKRFFQTAQELKRHPETAKIISGETFDFSDVIPIDTELICITQNETSTGTVFPLEALHNIEKTHPKTLIAVDIVSSAPYVSLDYTKLDCVFFSVQKGFGLPAGLALLIVSPRTMKKALQKQKAGKNVGSYHKFESMMLQAQKYQTIETPNVLDIYLLSKVLQDMKKKGIAKIRKQTERKAKLIYDFFDHHPLMHPHVTDKQLRSNTVIVIDTPQGSGPLISRLKEQGMIIGSGYGELKEKQIRIANFPAHSLKDMKNLIKAIDMSSQT